MNFNLISLLCLVALLLPGIAPAAPPAADYEKRLSETFPIGRDGRVRLDNRYGEIKVVTWAQPQVKVDVLIRVDANSESDFQDVLKRIDVRLAGGGNEVSAVTSIASSSGRGGGGGSWWNYLLGGGSSSDDFKIYYTVTLPASVNLEVAAKYCDVELPNLTGETTLDVAYGDLVAGQLTKASRMDVSYGSARIEQVGNQSTVKLRYSEGNFRKAGDLTYDGRYSEVRFGQVGVLRLDVGYEEVDVESATSVYLSGNYNELSVGRVDEAYLNGSYTDFNLGTVTRILEMDGNYGDLEVDALRPGFQRVIVRASYTDVQIDIEDSAGYTLDLSTRYGDIDVPTNNLSPRNIGSDNGTDYVRGTKAGTGTGNIKITTNYGDIELYEFAPSNRTRRTLTASCPALRRR